jgi:phenylacetate-coenzyme A ligase PaaK-like adenylate-forming protein
MLPPYDPWLTGSVSFDVSMATRAGPSALAERRRRRLVALLERAHERSPRYRRILAGRDPKHARLQDLPIAHKRELMDDFEDWVGDAALDRGALERFCADRRRIAEPFRERYVVWESSGSTGEPAIFVQDAAAMAVYDALEALRRPGLRAAQRWLDPWGLNDRTVFLGAVGGHFASNVSVERLRRLNPLLAKRLHAVSFLQPLDDLRRALERHEPTVLATYPSAAVLLAEEKLAGRLRIAPKEIWTGGETLTPAMRRHIHEAFGCPVVNSYGASEFLALASECNEGRMHVNSDWAVLEAVDEAGRAVGRGTMGARTLLTNLANHVQPIIRYDLGDRVRIEADTCPCGSHLPVIDVEGRADDTLHLAARASKRRSVLPLALSTVLEEAGLFDFQLVQRGPAELELRTAQKGLGAEAALRRGRSALAAFLDSQGADGVDIRCQPGEPLACGRSGKVRRVIAAEDA